MTVSPAVREARQTWGLVGTNLAFPNTPVETWRRQLTRLERLGYGSAWTNEGIGGKEAMAHLGVMLAATQRLVVGSGIANIWARHPAAMQGGAATLADAYPGRFALGVGVSHPSRAGRTDEEFRPLDTMRTYLDEMDAAAPDAPQPATPFPRLLAALGPRMLELAAERADGAFPAMMPVEHTAKARQSLGPDKLLVPGLSVIPTTERARVRATVSRLQIFRADSPYRRAFRQLGFTEEDLAGGGSDRFLDAVFAYGDEDAVAARVREHLDAGADHVVLYPFAQDLPTAVDHLEQLAPALVSVGSTSPR